MRRGGGKGRKKLVTKVRVRRGCRRAGNLVSWKCNLILRILSNGIWDLSRLLTLTLAGGVARVIESKE